VGGWCLAAHWMSQGRRFSIVVEVGLPYVVSTVGREGGSEITKGTRSIRSANLEFTGTVPLNPALNPGEAGV
jgi:hypothetical protein